MSVASFDASGASGVPATDLPVGVLFWRLRARGGGVTAATTSATWQFTVGAHTAPHDGSWGTTLDVHGDGYPALAIGAPSTARNVGATYLHLGTASGATTTPARTFTPPVSVNGGYGLSVAFAAQPWYARSRTGS